MKARVTMDSGAAGHVMLESMFPRVKHESKMKLSKMSKSDTWVNRHMRKSKMDNTQKCECCQAFFFFSFRAQIVRAGDTVLLDETHSEYSRWND